MKLALRATVNRIYSTSVASSIRISLRSLSTAPDMQDDHFIARDDQISQINERYTGSLQIQDCEKFGKGVFSQRSFRAGEFLVSSQAMKETKFRDTHTIQKDWNIHVVMDLPAVLINHSCAANAGVKDNARGAYDFYATRDILEGEEIFLDYEAVEAEIEGFPCSCGSSSCRENLKGFKHNGDIVKDQYGREFIASYLKTHTK